ncbi:MAG: FAD-dependent oxidoreductase [Patescibacteria group bacterium]|jgi:protoporphyrinogen oxidase
MKKKAVAVVGGGVAGLSAAYRLLQSGQCEVDIFEAKSYLGGRIQSREVQGQKIDFGGFLIYPWYTHCHQLLKDLDLERLLTRTPIKELYYVLEKNGSPLKLQEIPFSKIQTLQIWSKSLLRLLPEKDVADPGLDRFDRKTISEYVRSSLDVATHAGLFETYLDTLNQGYCYGPVSSVKASFMAPIFRQTALYGDVRSTSYFSHGTSAIIDQLATEITRLGGRIHLGTPITHVKGRTLMSDGQSFKNQAVIFAQNVTPDLYRDILKGVEAECWYTHFVTATVKLDVQPKCRETDDWGAIFYAPDELLSQQVLSAINLDVLYGPHLRNYVTLNVIIRGDRDQPIAASKVKAKLQAEILELFPECSTASIEAFVHWEKTMPVAQEAFVEAVRAAQGKNRYYFAGDFLGAPSIEAAISTGKAAAQGVIDAL